MEEKIPIKITGIVKGTVRDGKTGKIKREYKQKFNLITTVGRTVIAMILSGDTTYTGIINYGAVGTDDTAVSNSDTKLGTELFRKLKASASYIDNVAYISFFYSTTDFNNTGIKEFGTFIDGEAGADTGQIFTHLNVVWSKSNTETLTVDIIYTVS